MISTNKKLRVGLAFNMKRISCAHGDDDAEFDSPEAIEALRSAIASFGHEVVMLEADAGLPERLAGADVELVFNVAEGLRGRSRESVVPALCDHLGIEHTGSDAVALALSLDKALTKKLLMFEGVATPKFTVLYDKDDSPPPGFAYPAILKPIHEGTSKGLGGHSVVEDEPALRKLAGELIEKYRQPVIAEEYVSGREITVGLLGWPEPRALPVMEVIFLQPQERPVYGYELKQEWDGKLDYQAPARLTEKEEAACRNAALRAFAALECRDVARVDIRLAADGEAYVIEINPLPGLTPNYSDLAMIATADGMSHRDLIGAIMSCGISRLAGRK